MRAQWICDSWRPELRGRIKGNFGTLTLLCRMIRAVGYEPGHRAHLNLKGSEVQVLAIQFEAPRRYCRVYRRATTNVRPVDAISPVVADLYACRAHGRARRARADQRPQGLGVAAGRFRVARGAGAQTHLAPTAECATYDRSLTLRETHPFSADGRESAGAFANMPQLR